MSAINADCPTCFQPVELQRHCFGLIQGRNVSILPCNHQYHSICFQIWVDLNLDQRNLNEGTILCPLCHAESTQQHTGIKLARWLKIAEKGSGPLIPTFGTLALLGSSLNEPVTLTAVLVGVFAWKFFAYPFLSTPVTIALFNHYTDLNASYMDILKTTECDPSKILDTELDFWSQDDRFILRKNNVTAITTAIKILNRQRHEFVVELKNRYRFYPVAGQVSERERLFKNRCLRLFVLTGAIFAKYFEDNLDRFCKAYETLTEQGKNCDTKLEFYLLLQGDLALKLMPLFLRLSEPDLEGLSDEEQAVILSIATHIAAKLQSNS